MGALAVALGIGAAVASCPGIALADPEASTSSSTDGVGSGSGRGDAVRDAPQTETETEDTSSSSGESPDPESVDPDIVDEDTVETSGPDVPPSEGKAVTSRDRAGSSGRDDSEAEGEATGGSAATESAPADEFGGPARADKAVGADEVLPNTTLTPNAATLEEGLPVKAAAAVLAEPPPPPVELVELANEGSGSAGPVQRWLTAALKPLMGTDPAAPPDSPLLLAFLAAARRAGDPTLTQQAAATTSTSAEVLWPDDAVVVSSRIGKYLQGIVLSPDGRRLYVADMDSGSVRVVDAGSGRPLRSISVGEGPYGLALTPDGKRLFVTVNAENIVKIIDTATNRVIGEPIAIPEDPRQIVVSPDGRRVYVSHSQNFNRDSAITVIDVATLKAVGAPMAVAGGQQFMAVSRDGKRLFVQTYDFDAQATHVAVLDAATGAVIGPKIPTTAAVLAVSPDEQRFYAAGENNTVHIIDAASGTTIGDVISVTSMSSSMAVSPDGTRLYVYGFGSDWGVVSVVDTSNSTVLSAIEIGAWPGEITISADGRRIYTSGTNGTVTVIDTAKLEGKNSAPVVTIRRQGSPSSSGRVTGSVVAIDSDKDRLTYTGMTTGKGTATVTSGGSFTYTPTAAARHAAAANDAPASAKTDTFTVTVSDGKGGIASVPITVTIPPLNSTPTSTRSTVAKPDPASGVVTGRITSRDRDGDTLTYTASPLTSGAITLNADGTFNYAPTEAAREKARTTRGTDTERFKITVDDGHGGIKTVSVSVTIAPRNDAPQTGIPTTAAPNATTGAVTGTVNAVDPDGDRIIYTAGTTTTGKGRFTVTSRGSFTYAPTPAARAAAGNGDPSTATDTINVTAKDSLGAVATIPVTIAILPTNSAPGNAKPILNEPNTSTGTVTGTVTATDPDGDPLTYGGSTDTAKGTVTVNTNGSFTYTPTGSARHAAAALNAPASAKTDTFAVTITDGRGGVTTVPVSVSISPRNTAPTATVDAGQPNPTTGVVFGTVIGSDPDGDTLTYSGTASTEKGAVTVGANGSFTYTPTAAARAAAATSGAPASAKTDTFTVSIADGYGGVAYVPVVLAISPAKTNRPPQVGNPAFGYSTDQRTGVVSGTVQVIDPDGDGLHYRLANPIDPGLGAVTIDAATGNWTYTPTRRAREIAYSTAEFDTATFSVIATDGDADIHVDVEAPIAEVGPSPNNGPPVVAETAFTVDAVDDRTGAISGHMNITDPDGDPLSFSVPNLPAGGALSVNAATGQWTYMPSAQEIARAWTERKAYSVQFSVSVTDGLHSASVPVAAEALASIAAVTNGLEMRGSRPNGVAVAADGRIYVINDGAASLSILEPDGRVVRTVRVGRSPSDVAIDGRGRVWITDAQDGTVSILDADAAQLRTIAVGAVPTSISMSADRAYITNFGSDSVSVIDLDDYTTQTLAGIGSGPIDAVVDSNGVVYVANFGDSTITLVNQNGQILRTVSSGGRNPSGIAVDGGTIYVTHPLDDNVTVISGQLSQPLRAVSRSQQVTSNSSDLTYFNIRVLGAPTRITRDGAGRIYVTTSAGKTISVINPATLAASTIGVGANANSVYADDRGNIYVTNGALNTVSVINAVTNSVIHHNVGVRTGTVNIDSAGNLVLLNDYDGTRLPIASSQPDPARGLPSIARVYGDYSNFVVSDDNLMLYAVRRTSLGIEIAAIDPVTNRVVSTLSIPSAGVSAAGNGMAIAAYGTRLFVTSHVQETGRYRALVHVVDTSGPALELDRSPIELNQGSDFAYIQDLAVNADGTELYVIGERVYLPTDADVPNPRQLHPVGTIWIVDVADQVDITRVSIPESMRQEGIVQGLALANDGEHFYVGITPGVTGAGNYHLGVVDTKTRQLSTLFITRLTDSDLFSQRLAISPDGTRVFTETGHIVSIAASQPYVVADTRLEIDRSSTSPQITGMAVSRDGTKVYVTRWNGGLEVFDATAGSQIGETIALGGRALKLRTSDEGGTLYLLSGVDYVAGIADANSVEDLWKNVRNLPNDGNGGVFVQTVRNDLGQNRLIVYIGGTVPAYLLTGNQAIGENVPTELGNVKGDQVAAIKNVLQQCRENATCGTVSEVMIVGYSQGGIDAQNLANQWARLGFDAPLGTILTFGSPVTSNVNLDVLHIQDAQDEVVIPELVARYIIDAAIPFPDWLMQSLTKARRLASDRGQILIGNAATENYFLDPFRVHGTYATYQDLAKMYDEGHYGNFAADAAIDRFLSSDVIVPGNPTPTPL
ncbi:YVTN family beta-propeller protein/VCBS repeat-containing protein [Mycolicibacterium iranicum]|uniref:YVTN family beta-propeller protein/VCBS repeat-containing protein n=1 Tax=Mycolicibacterium iranicum TaxID=912594 RepID=A0A839PXK0_MYCIR|nr:Ig-like domain-containing protein [Mycolicibacterium iranicum]MBB2988918.1 YVTN family beta-propeller protein/VCBS repeat-containing protein [Mycolicibacterium iranicum]